VDAVIKTLLAGALSAISCPEIRDLQRRREGSKGYGGDENIKVEETVQRLSTPLLTLCVLRITQ
jgi:hypothetical protein